MGERARRIVSPALAVLAAVALLVSLVGGYAWRALFDSGQFADRATAALDSDAVQNEIGRAVAAQLIEVDDNLIAVKPVLESVASGLVGTGAFQDIFRAGVKDLHRSVLKQDQDTVTLTVADIGATIRGTLEALQPKLAKKIPANFGSDLLEEDPPDILVDLIQAEHDSEWVPLALLAIGLLLGFGSMWVALDRRRAGVHLGVAVAIAGVVALVGLRIGHALVLNGIDEQGARDAVEGIWGAYVDDLTTALYLFAACGAVLAAAASSLLAPVDVGAQLRRGWAFALRVPERPVWRAVRGLILIALGVLIAVRTEEFLRIVGVLVGLYIAYAGVAELMRLSIADQEVIADHRRRGRRSLLATGVVAVAVLLAAALFISVGGISEESEAIVTEGCNGSEQLCDRTLDEVAFPSTHNAMSAVTNPDWLFGQQDAGFPDQLHDGIRGLLIDAHYGVETESGAIKTDLSELDSGEREAYVKELGPEALDAALRIRDRLVDSPEVGKRQVYLCHRFCELGALPITQAFGDYRDFLAANHEEVLVLDIEDYVEPADIAAAAKQSGLDEYVYDGPLDPLPTLQQMIDSGGRVLMLAEHEGGGTQFPWYHAGYEGPVQETPYSFKKPAELTDPDELRASCKPNRGTDDAPMFLVNHWVDTAPAPKPGNAEAVNAHDELLARIHRCERQRDLEANLVAVDFYRRGDLFEVTDELNAERAAQSR